MLHQLNTTLQELAQVIDTTSLAMALSTELAMLEPTVQEPLTYMSLSVNHPSNTPAPGE
jgi:hypothetical protein